MINIYDQLTLLQLILIIIFYGDRLVKCDIVGNIVHRGSVITEGDRKPLYLKYFIEAG
jgi:hypothetical protein